MGVSYGSIVWRAALVAALVLAVSIPILFPLTILGLTLEKDTWSSSAFLGLTFGFYGYLLYDAYPQGIAHYIGLFLMISQPFWR